MHLTLHYVYNSGSYNPLARIESFDHPEKQTTDIAYYHVALNGLPEELTDSQGRIIWHGDYSLWGKLRRETRPVPGFRGQQNLRFQGQYFDRETGLHYNTFRYYAPDTGRFTQQDPIGLAGGLNLYQYAPNPVMWVDPWGWAVQDSFTTFYHAGDIQGAIDPSNGRVNLDFNPSGKGGFYVTTDLAQAADWAKKRGHPTITQFNVPNSELAKLDIKAFNSATREWADFSSKGRQGTLNHGYDAVSGPMIENPAAVRKGRKPLSTGTQFAIFSDKAAKVFDRYKVKGC